jgi:pyridoxamine 5'-phosphate oxidase
VRAEGVAEVVTAAESDEYFARRPLGSRLGAWASRQSDVIPDRAFLEQRHAELTAKYADGAVPRPANWGGYRVVPTAFEFWQGRPSRLHDRIRFTRGSNGWVKDRLSP